MRFVNYLQVVYSLLVECDIGLLESMSVHKDRHFFLARKLSDYGPVAIVVGQERICFGQRPMFPQLVDDPRLQRAVRWLQAVRCRP